MIKITFAGAGSTVFAKHILGDLLLKKCFSDITIALYDIDSQRLEDSYVMMCNLNKNINKDKAVIEKFFGVPNRKKALRNADFIINAIQVGGYKPSTIIDFEIPRKYGLLQTIGDTLGVGGIFRALRTAPVMLDFAQEIHKVCPNAWLLNYTNPMAILTGTMLKATNVKTIGLCHSVQVCAPELLKKTGLSEQVKDLRWKIAGINHMAWLLEIRDGNKDIYPEIRKKAININASARKPGAVKHNDMIRFEIMKHFGYYVTESSEHNAEYLPYWIKRAFPQLIEEFNIPLDEYPKRCIKQISEWDQQRRDLVRNTKLSHSKTAEYGADIIEAIVNNKPFMFGGNVLNKGSIDNLPSNAVVEVPCIADGNGITPLYVGSLPSQCAALNMTNINVHLLATEAILSGKKELIYQAAMLDPHTSSELTLDQIVELCDDMIKAHGNMLKR